MGWQEYQSKLSAIRQKVQQVLRGEEELSMDELSHRVQAIGKMQSAHWSIADIKSAVLSLINGGLIE